MRFVFTIILFTVTFVSTVAQTKPDLPSKWYLYETKNYDLYFTRSDSSDIIDYLAYFDNANETIKKYFGHDFLTKYDVYVHPNRSSINLQWSADWNMPGFTSECWMVGSGVADQFDLLSLKAWVTEACEHNPNDVIEIQQLITHESMHVYHGQINLNHFFEGMQDMSWFIEGIAVLVSGQLDKERLDDVKKIVSEDRYPRKLNRAWEGNYRYGICGSLVAYIGNEFGRGALKNLLEARSNQEILQILDTTEDELFKNWADYILSD